MIEPKPGYLHYLGLKDTSNVKGNLFITSYMFLNERGNYLVDFDDCKGNWHSLKPSDIEMEELKKNDPEAYKFWNKYQKRKEVSPEDFPNVFDILSIREMI